MRNSCVSAGEKAFQWRQSLQLWNQADLSGEFGAPGPVAAACAQLGLWEQVLQLPRRNDEDRVIGAAIVSLGGHSSGESDMDEARWEEVERAEEQSPDLKADLRRLADAPSMLSVLQEERVLASIQVSCGSLLPGTKGCRYFMGGHSGSGFAKSDECLQFLEEQAEAPDLPAVVVEHGCRSADVYSVGPGNAIVGVLEETDHGLEPALSA
eukprot:Skav207788  [mRNA]  locus=scaffold70:218717:222016:- [translate_table: standard]